MFYDAQIAGLPDSWPAVRQMKRRSDTVSCCARRAEIVSAARALDGPGLRQRRRHRAACTSRVSTRRLTELAAGSGPLRARPSSTATTASCSARPPSSPRRSCAGRRRASSRHTAAATSRRGRPGGRGCPAPLAEQGLELVRTRGRRARCRHPSRGRRRPPLAGRSDMVPPRQGGRAGRALHGVRPRRARRRPGRRAGRDLPWGRAVFWLTGERRARPQHRVVQLGRHRVDAARAGGDPAQRGGGRRGGRAPRRHGGCGSRRSAPVTRSPASP